MLKEQSKVKVHLYDGISYPKRKTKLLTRDTVFEVRKQDGKLGIDWNTNHCPYTSNGDTFAPFSSFSYNVEFEDIDTGKIYHFSTIANKLKEIERT